VPLPKLLDSFCVGVLLTGGFSPPCDMDSLGCPARYGLGLKTMKQIPENRGVGVFPLLKIKKERTT
jgi:hypothetical protein